MSLDCFGVYWLVNIDKALRNAKPSKERISVFIAANCLGEKLNPIVIGKSKTPRCFRNKNQLPVIYRYNQNAWMTSEIWTNYVKQLNKTMTIENRRIILFVDNCPAHSFIELSNIKLVFLPPNTTSRLQPMDAGVIHSLKASYRKRLVKRFLAIYEEKRCFDLKDIDLYDAIILLNNIWQDMDPTIIENCFHQSGFLCHINDDDTPQVVTEDSNQSIPVDVNDWNQLKEALDSNELEFNEFVRFDDNVVCTEEQTNPLIEKSIEFVEKIDDNSCDDMEYDEYPETDVNISLNDGFKAINTLRKLFTQNDCLDEDFIHIKNLENLLYSRRFAPKIQSKITSYFK